MKFRAPGNGVEFEIPDEWWTFSDMPEFRPGRFYPYPQSYVEVTEVVPLREIEPPIRDAHVPSFRKYKLVPVLLAFTSPECSLPPVQAIAIASGGNYKYRVTNGYHRYYASVAAGFEFLPITEKEHAI